MYNASIKIKQPADFIFNKIQHISQKYNKPESFVKRVSVDYFISVYCEKDGKFQLDKKFSEFHGERLKTLGNQYISKY